MGADYGFAVTGKKQGGEEKDNLEALRRRDRKRGKIGISGLRE